MNGQYISVRNACLECLILADVQLTYHMQRTFINLLHCTNFCGLILPVRPFATAKAEDEPGENLSAVTGTHRSRPSVTTVVRQ